MAVDVTFFLSGSVIPCLRWVFTHNLSASRTANASRGSVAESVGRPGIRSRMMSFCSAGRPKGICTCACLGTPLP